MNKQSDHAFEKMKTLYLTMKDFSMVYWQKNNLGKKQLADYSLRKYIPQLTQAQFGFPN